MPIVSKRWRIAYFATPKVACTSIKTAMHRLVIGDPAATVDAHGLYPNASLKPWDFVGLRDFYKFAVVRDPAERLLSAYDFCIGSKRIPEKAQDTTRTKVLEALVPLSRYDTKEYRELPLDPDLDTFVRKIELYNAKYQFIWGHTREQAEYLGRDLGRFDRIFRISELSELEADIRRRTKTAFAIPKTNVTNVSRRARLGDLTQQGFDALMSYLEPDYQLLADFFERPKYPEPLLTE